MRTACLRLGLLAMCAGLSGCVIPVPLPAGELNNTRQNIGEEVPAFIVLGATNRTDILLKLGEPDIASENALQFIYVRGVYLGGTAVVLCAFQCGAVPIEKTAYDRLILTFDDSNVVSTAVRQHFVCTSLDVPGPCSDLRGRDVLPTHTRGVASADAFARAMLYPGLRLSEVRGSFLSPSYFAGVPPSTTGAVQGIVVVGESAVLFYSTTADAKSAPIYTIPYSEIVAVNMLRFGTAARGVIIERANGQGDSLAIGVPIQGRGVIEPYWEETENLGKLVQSRWKAAMMAK